MKYGFYTFSVFVSFIVFKIIREENTVYTFLNLDI